MERLVATNMEQTAGYGEDSYCARARRAIIEAIGCPDASVHFLVGGTQANTTVIASLLRPYQGVICAHTGHINVHETGAIEHTGHKVLALPAFAGKTSALQIEQAVADHPAEDGPEHMVQPGMVYISFPTEIGTIYSKQQLSDIYSTCQRLNLPLFIDGARLGYGLASPECDITLADLPHLCDVFYIGGTKVGALFGEAVVIGCPALKEDFRYLIKQHGGMLAKGRLLGVQFDALMTDNLYFEISAHADALADRLRDTLLSLNVPFLVPGVTNQLFPILPDSVLDKLSETYVFCEQQRVDETHRAVRLCTSWATREEAVDALCGDLRLLLGKS